MAKPADIEMVKEALPYLRSLVALVIYLRSPINGIDESYKRADKFISQLQADL